MNKHWILIMFSWLCFFVADPVFSQQDPASLHKLYGGIGLHGGTGWSFYGKGTTNTYKSGTFLPNGGVHARWFFAKKVAIYHTLDYLSLGAKSKFGFTTTELRIRSLQLSNSVEFFFNAKPTRPVLSLKGGFFIGRNINSTHYWKQSDSGLSGQNTPINSFGDWNGGLTTGAEVSKKVGKAHCVSGYLQYDLGIKNVASPNLEEGINVFTRAYRLGIGFTL